MKIPHPIPYQGSKRNLAYIILSFFPNDTIRLVEPFAGSAAISLASSFYSKANIFILNDINQPLMKLWDEIINNPDVISQRYEELWNEQHGREKEFYKWARTEFNKNGRSDFFLFLLTRCVKASVRYNSNGEFNQSPDNRRKGTRPITMRQNIFGASCLFKGKTLIMNNDYKDVLEKINCSDVVYMDPPYQGVSKSRDPRYVEGTSLDSFIETLDYLHKRGISYMVSYDGRTGTKSFGEPLPSNLKLTHVEINTGRSSQATLLGRKYNTYESLYLSEALVARIGGINQFNKQFDQVSLFEKAL